MEDLFFHSYAERDQWRKKKWMYHSVFLSRKNLLSKLEYYNQQITSIFSSFRIYLSSRDPPCLSLHSFWGSLCLVTNQEREYTSHYGLAQDCTHFRVPCQFGKGLIRPVLSLCPILLPSSSPTMWVTNKHLAPQTLSRICF